MKKKTKKINEKYSLMDLLDFLTEIIDTAVNTIMKECEKLQLEEKKKGDDKNGKPKKSKKPKEIKN